MKIPTIFMSLSATASLCAQMNNVNFNAETPGNIPSSDWLQTNIAAPEPPEEDAMQRNLFQYAPSLGINGTGGVTLDGTIARQLYQMVYRNDNGSGEPQSGVVGDLYRVSTELQIDYNGAAPAFPNRTIYSVLLTDTEALGGGSNLAFNLTYRGVDMENRNFFGFTIGSNGENFDVVGSEGANAFVLEGFSPFPLIGLPAATGESATSHTLKLELSLEKVAGQTDQWRVRTRITNKDTDTILFDNTGYNLDGNGETPAEELLVILPENIPLYGKMGTGFFAGDSTSTLEEEISVTQIASDNFEISSFSLAVNEDGDGLNQVEEALLGTDDTKQDTDDDGFNDDVEVTAGSNPLDKDSTPVVNLLINESLTNLADGPIGDSPMFNAQAAFASENNVVTSTGRFQRAQPTTGFLASEGTGLAEGDVIGLRIDFRLRGPVDLGDLGEVNTSAIRIALTDVLSSGNAQALVGAGINTNTFENGILRFGTFTDDFDGAVGEAPIVPVPEFFDLSGYDTADDVTPRSNGNSDWLRLGAIIRILPGDDNEFQILQTLDDLEGANRNSFENEYFIIKEALNLDETYVFFNTATIIGPEDGFDPVSSVEFRSLRAGKLIDVDEDDDDDNLTNGREFILGTSPAKKDTDGDGLDDDVDPDPLVPAVTGAPRINSVEITAANSFEVSFTGESDQEYQLTMSTSLMEDSFLALDPAVTVTTDNTGNGTLSTAVNPDSTAKQFFRIERN